MDVASMFSVLIFKTIPRVRTRSAAGVLRPWTAAWQRYFRSKPVAELREIKSAAVPKRCPQIHCDGTLEWSLKWTWRSNVVNDVRTLVRTLLKSINAWFLRHRHCQIIMTFRLPVKHRFRQTDNLLWKNSVFTSLLAYAFQIFVACNHRHYKFSMQSDHSKSQPTDNKLPLKGAWSRHMPTLYLKP